MYKLPQRVLDWVIHSTAPEATVQSVHRMKGGISSIVCSITLRISHTDLADIDVVLRLFDNTKWVSDEPDLALHESSSLIYALSCDTPTPRIIALDEDGSSCGVPAVLMTRLTGSVELTPPDIDTWINSLALTLVHIHKMKTDNFAWNYSPYMDISKFEVPTWSNYPEQWDRIINIVKGPRPKSEPCFIHRDYHPTNVLWHENKVSGVVDWVNACIGPAGVDIGHCRWNLAMLYGTEAADAFLLAYIAHADSEFQYDPYWDLRSLIDVQFGPPSVYSGWTELGFDNLNDELMKKRTDDYMLSLLKRAMEG